MDIPKSVVELKSINFLQMELQDKMTIKKLGRPMPDLKINQVYTKQDRQYVRRFKQNFYEKNDWICGCDVTNSFYCFPCILYGGSPAWTIKGVNDLKHINEKELKHENSVKHIQNVKELDRLGKSENFAPSIPPKYQKHLVPSHLNKRNETNCLCEAL